MRGTARLTAVAAALWLVAPVWATDLPAAPLQERVAALAAELEGNAWARAGVSAADLRSGETLADIRAGELFIPASNQKILTSAYALTHLGDKAEFTTAVYLRGNDIMVVGDGDPTLGDSQLAQAEGKDIYWQLDEWAQAAREKVGTKIGDLVVVVSGPGEGFRHEDWPRQQRNNWYAAPVASLNFNNNCFDISFTAAGGQLTPQVSPVSRFIRVVNNTKAGKQHRWSASSNSDDSVLTITGTVAATGRGEPMSVAGNNPPMLLGWVLADRLARAGVTMSGTVRPLWHGYAKWDGAVRIARTTTPLAAVLARANKRSLNMAAECVFLNAGDGTWRGSAMMMTKGLQLACGLGDGDLVVRDGSGLSRLNRVSPQALTQVLRHLARRDDVGVFLDSLPISGEDGTLHRRLAGEAYRQRVLAKTGYIAGVSALSGYILDGKGKPAIAFSMLLNDVKSAGRAKAFQDTVCRMLVDYLEAQETEEPAQQ